MRPLSMAHNVLEISGRTGLAFFSDHGVMRGQIRLGQPPPSSSHHLFELNLYSI
jgi:hypothetical protein